MSIYEEGDKYPATGYRWQCSCGEMFRTQEAAWACKKCPKYLNDEDFFHRVVLNVAGGETYIYKELLP